MGRERVREGERERDRDGERERQSIIEKEGEVDFNAHDKVSRPIRVDGGDYLVEGGGENSSR